MYEQEEECCPGYYVPAPPSKHDTYAYSFDYKWYASINGQLKLIPVQVSNREEALEQAQIMNKETHTNG